MENKKLPETIKFIIGIDEVGRGPLAGPIAIGAFKMPVGFSAKGFGRIKDSKKLLPKVREEIFAKLQKLKRNKIVDYSVCFESAKRIDKIHIARTIKNCIKESLKNLKTKTAECIILLDGGLKASKIYKNQKTIIGGDRKERAIAFASIVAKVLRDRRMNEISKKYPQYGFEIHKGYGTKMHCELIKKNGLCPEHRKYFCKNLL